MRKDVPNINLPSIEVNSSSKSVSVATDVKDNKAINIIRTAKVLLQFIVG